MSLLRDLQVKYGDSLSLDSFGRLRTSELTTQVEVKQFLGTRENVITTGTNGTGSITDATATKAASTLNAPASGDWAVIQTKQCGYYQVGKSQLIFMTVSRADIQTDIVKQVGYFSADPGTIGTGLDGIFFSVDTDYNFEVQRNGTTVKKATRTADWLDKFDGNGPSGKTISDWSKSLILFIDFEWLGVGRTRFGFVIDGVPYLAYEHNNATINELVYMLSPNQPIRWAINNTAGTVAGVMDAICGSVSSEGSKNEIGEPGAIDDNGTVITCGTAGTYYLLLAIRLQDPRAIIELKNAIIQATSANDKFRYRILLNPSIAGSVSWTNSTDNNISYLIGTASNTVTGGYIMQAGSGSTDLDIASEVESALRPGTSFGGTYDVIAIALSPSSGSTNVTVHRAANFIQK